MFFNCNFERCCQGELLYRANANAIQAGLEQIYKSLKTQYIYSLFGNDAIFVHWAKELQNEGKLKVISDIFFKTLHCNDMSTNLTGRKLSVSVQDKVLRTRISVISIW